MHFNNILFLNIRANLTPLYLFITVIHHRRSIIPKRLISSTGSQCIGVAWFLIFVVGQILNLNTVSPDIDSSVNSKKILEALIVKDNVIFVFLNFSWRSE